MNRLEFASSMFSGVRQYANFCRMDTIFPTVSMSASPRPCPFPEGPLLKLPKTYLHEGQDKELEAFLADTDTVALLVLKDGLLGLERYALGVDRDTRWLSMSMAKSFTSAALGIAWAEGAFGVNEPVTKYLPQLKGSAYDEVAIRHIVQMSSGARWDEDYSNPESDINRYIRVFAHGGSFNEFAATLVRQREPGTYNLYNSMDTQVLGMLLKAVTGRSIRDFVEERLWHPLGMERDAYWLIDSDRMEMAYGGLNATARDYAKLGELFRRNGNWHGRQIVPAEWVKASVTPDAPHLLPGDTGKSDSLFGYGYQWWLMDGEEGEFSAIGVYNQFIYVNPARRLTIVKLSANPIYGQTNDERSYREFETVAMLRAIGMSLG